MEIILAALLLCLITLASVGLGLWLMLGRLSKTLSKYDRSLTGSILSKSSGPSIRSGRG